MDEVGDLPPELQPKLLRVLQEKQVERLGGSSSLPVDVRVVAATNHGLCHMVQEGEVSRRSLLSTGCLSDCLTPLRERKEDIPLLVDHFIKRYSGRAGKIIERVDQSTLRLFQTYDWPGNIRELQNIVERAVIVADTSTLFVHEKWLGHAPAVRSIPRDGLSALAEHEAAIIEAALAESRGRISGPSGAATKLRMRRQTLESKIKRLGIDKHEFALRLPESTRVLRTAAASA